METLRGRDMWEFWGRWVIATFIGWVGGFILAIVLSYSVVNFFYPKETNLIVGACLGGTVSFSQRFAIRRWLDLGPIYVWGAVIGIGIPFAITVLMSEWGAALGPTESILLLATGALACGLLQARALRIPFGGMYVWPLITMLVWTGAWLISRVPNNYGIVGATAIHGIVSGGTLIWLLGQRWKSNPGVPG